MFLYFKRREKRGKMEAPRPRFLVLRRKTLTVGAALLAAAAIFGAVNAPAAVRASVATRQLPIYCVEREQKMCSVSFDAAWGNEDTQQLIDILEKYKVKATFFVVGEWVDKYPESVKALADAGHEVMNHSNTHAHYPQLSPQAVVDDLNACNDKIEAVTGVRPTLVRLPYGDYDDNAIRAVRSTGMEPIQWDVDSLDWKNLGVTPMVERVTKNLAPGAIVLFDNMASLEALWALLLDDATRHTPGLEPERLAHSGAQVYELLMHHSGLPAENSPVKEMEDLVRRLTAGMAVLLLDGCKKGIVFSVQGLKSRSVEEPSGEGNLRGSREGFADLLRVNLSLLRRLIRTDTLVMETAQADCAMKTEYAICYLSLIHI